MHPTKWYNGMCLVSVEGIYAVVDKATKEVKCTGSYEKCDAYFTEYVNKESEG